MAATSMSKGNINKTLSRILKTLENIEQELKVLNKKSTPSSNREERRPVRNKGYINNNSR